VSLRSAPLSVVFNPASGRRRDRRLRAVVDSLKARGREVELHRTEGPGHAREIAREIASRGRADAVIAAGGDGTVNEIADGLEGPHPMLGVIPTGTANVLALELGLPRDPGHLAALLHAGHTRSLRPGRFSGATQGSFVLMVGAGFDARAVAAVNPALKRIAGKGAYAASGLSEWLRGYPGTVEVEVDGRHHHAGWVVVANARRYAGNFIIAPDADLGRADFEVLCLAGGSRIRLAIQSLCLVLGMTRHLPWSTRMRTAEVRLLGPANAPVQVDGDHGGRLPMTLTPRCDTLRVLAPNTGATMEKPDDDLIQNR
jgi:diacylglycerol kinase (ATP)